MRRFLILIVVFAIWPPGFAGDAPSSISVIAHRGASAEAPENSLAAIEAAVQMGCDIVEVDVRVSQDGRVVLMHDATVDRTTNGRGRVDQLPWARLRSLDAGVSFAGRFRRTRIPLLEEAISQVRGRATLYLDLKVTDFEPVVSVVRRAKFSNSVFYRVYRPLDAGRLVQLDPSSRVIVDIDQFGSLPGTVDLVLSRHPDAILTLDIDNWSERLENVVRQHSSRWFVNVLGRQTSVSKLHRAVDLRPTGIMTDSPRLLLDMLRRHGSEPGSTRSRSGK